MEMNDSGNKLIRPVNSSSVEAKDSQWRWWPCLILSSATVVMMASVGSFTGITAVDAPPNATIVKSIAQPSSITWWYIAVTRSDLAPRKANFRDIPRARPMSNSFRLLGKIEKAVSETTDISLALNKVDEPVLAETTPSLSSPTDLMTTTKRVRSGSLEEGLSPVHYVLEIHPVLETSSNFSFTGYVVVTFICRIRTSRIALHATAMLQVKVVRLVATFRTVQEPLPIEKVARSFSEDLIIVHLKENLHKNEHYNLTLAFSGLMGEEMDGLYRASYYDPSGTVRWVALTGFKPKQARRVFPCFDDPALRASFDVVIVRNKNMNTLCNMPVSRTERRSTDLVADHFARTPKIPTYLIAFTVNDFHSFGKGTMRIWTRASTTHLAQKMVIDVVPKLLEYYEDYYEIKYPMPKLDIVAFANCSIQISGYFGLVFMKEPMFLLLNPRRTMAKDSLQRLSALAHVISGQWFGNHVTVSWWNSVWLSYALASVNKYSVLKRLDDYWSTEGLELVYDVHEAMYKDSYESSFLLSDETGSQRTSEYPFLNANPKKGIAVVRMLEDFLDGENFRKGLNYFLQYYKYEGVTEDAAWNTFNKVTAASNRPVNVTNVMHTWARQEGYPIVTVKRFHATGSARISQCRYYLSEPQLEQSPLWIIPVTHTTGEKPAFVDHAPVTWLTTSQDTLHANIAKDTWLLLNVKAKGFYRVNYDQKNWAMLIAQLKEDHTKIHPLNRAQILNDLFDFARSGNGKLSLALSACQYLSREMEFTPWKAAVNAWKYIESFLATTALLEKWRAFVLRLIVPIYTALNWEEVPTDDVQKTLLRKEVYKLACMYNHPPCIDHARLEFKVLRNGSGLHNRISRNHRGFVYCKAVELGDYTDWKFLWEIFVDRAHESGLERAELLWALTCSSNQRVTRTLLKKTLNERKLKAKDCVMVFDLVAQRGVAERNIVLDFIRWNWPSMLVMWRHSFIEILVRISTRIVDEKELDEVRSIYYSFNDTLIEATWAFQTLGKAVQSNKQWMAVQYKELQYWLDANGK